MRYQVCVAVLAALGVALGLSGPATAAPEDAQGYLGVMVAPDAERGTLVREVVPDGPAAGAGLKAGDRVLKVGDQDVKDADEFLKIVAGRKPGEKLALTVDRGGKELALTATLAKRPAAAARPEPPAAPVFLGVQLRPLTAELREQLKVKVEHGAVVADVAPGSPAEQARLKRNDVITAADDKPVKGPDELRDAIQRAGTGKEVALTVARGAETLTVKATPRAGPFLVPWVESFPFPEVGPPFDPGRRNRELERRIRELEKRVEELERKLEPKK
jgi:serine protease Do